MATFGTLVVAAIALGTLCLSSGCSTLGYYAQSVSGHLGIVAAAKPVPDWLADPATSAALKSRLELSQRMRDFAISELKEPDNASYRRYADLERNAAVWNVVAAPELSLQLHTWCYLVVGCVGYRGYYHQQAANDYAQGLRDQGLEVSVYGVPAYSTLGKLPGRWFADPLLNTFIDYPEGELAGLIFHELAHQIAFANGDTVFNESFATAVERIGSERWLREHSSEQARAQYARLLARQEDFRALTMRYRDRLDALYTGTASDAEKRSGKAALMAELRTDYDTLKRERWNGYAGYDGWFARANNASFGVLAAYNQLVPNFDRLYERVGGNWNVFYGEVRRIAALPTPADRRLALP